MKSIPASFMAKSQSTKVLTQISANDLSQLQCLISNEPTVTQPWLTSFQLAGMCSEMFIERSVKYYISSAKSKDAQE